MGKIRADLLDLLNPGLTRRDFIKLATASIALLVLDLGILPKMVRSLEEAVAKKPAVIWLEGQDCAGCSEAFLNSLEPTAVEILLQTISLRYHETAMAASGHLAEEVLHKTIKEGGYVLVIEGAIPLAEDWLFCVIGGRPFKEIVRDCARNAAAIICAGACSSYGGIPRSGPTDAVGYLFRGTRRHHYYDDVGEKPVINLPSCPVHPERIVAVLTYYLTFGKPPELDAFHRPLAFYKYSQHENCERRGHFEAGRFLTDWGDPKQQGWCLYLKGCKGPWAHQDCWRRLWNTRTNYCIQANHPCIGCSEPEFYESFSPMYERQFDFKLPPFGRIEVDEVMTTIGGAVAAGVGAHALISLATKRFKGSKEKEG